MTGGMAQLFWLGTGRDGESRNSGPADSQQLRSKVPNLDLEMNRLDRRWMLNGTFAVQDPGYHVTE